MVVGLNEQGLVHDFYYPYVGQDNLTTARSVHHKIGIWVDSTFSWIDDPSWSVSVDFEDRALISKINASNENLNITLEFCDFVDAKHNVFCRKVKVDNHNKSPKDIKIFFHQVFQISRDGRADTAFFVPSGNYIFDYKGHCSLLIYACDQDGKPFSEFAVGNYAIESKAGTFVDAEDGKLSGNLVEHGSVDSVIACQSKIGANSNQTFYYWVVADDSQTQAEQIHNVFKSDFEERLSQTRLHWHKWLKKAEQTATIIGESYKSLFLKSLLIVKAHTDKHGGLIASCDSSIYNYGRDYYTYVWPRDGALSMLPLIDLGYSTEPKRFFTFCSKTIHKGGYMMHKYQPDMAIGSTWHPLMHQNHPELAIQEDETASVIFALGRYFDKSNDIEYLQSIYPKLVKPAADFMASFIDERTNLPHASYDLWEETFGTHTYTVLATYSALVYAVKMADTLGHDDDSKRWTLAIDRIRSGISLLINPDTGIFRRSLNLSQEDNLTFDERVDSATTYAILTFGQDLILSEQLNKSFEHLIKTVYGTNPAGGVIRYENDAYFLKNSKYKGNAWFICTLWLCQYLIEINRKELAQKLLDWTVSHSTPSGVLSEQIDAESGEQIGVAPLVWSHAELINTLNRFFK